MKTNDQLSQATGEAVRLSEIVAVRSRFLRSVNLERDFGTDAPLDGYVPTPGALAALARIAEGVRTVSERAWSVTGPYGTGKSAFALLLAKTLALPPMGDADCRRLASVPLFERDAEGYWPVLVTGGREPLARALARGLRPLADMLPPGALMLPQEGGASDALGGRDVARLYETASAALTLHVPHCRGLLVIVDELGKFLEYAALHPQAGDVQVLQEMAEAAGRKRYPCAGLHMRQRFSAGVLSMLSSADSYQ